MSKRWQILSISLIYLMVALTHVFYLPRITSVTTQTHNSIFKRKIEKVHTVNYLERTAKAVFKETVKSPSSNLPIVYLNSVFIGLKVENPQIKSFILNSRSFKNHRYSYLSYCTFRV
ncbi:MAG TPA: hypothetical protein VK668_17985 [Mucilaginibacter sp.]|nr:hypothetical protein [Mucilaginibacter sp.]